MIVASLCWVIQRKKRMISMDTTNLDVSDPDPISRRAKSAQATPPDSAKRAPSGRSVATVKLIANVVALSFAASLMSSPLLAGGLSANAGESIRVGGYNGVLYYTNENGGYQITATIAQGEAGTPVRFSATLAEDCPAMISVPGKPGDPAQSLEILGSGGKLKVIKVGSGPDQANVIVD